MRKHGPPETSRRWADTSGADDVRGRILDHLMEVLHAFRRVLLEVVDEHELTPMHLFALRALEEPTPMGALAELLHCDRSHITGVADELEGRGAVERQAHPSDRRVKLLALTPEGAELRDRLEAELLSRSPVAQGLSAEEQEQLSDLLARAGGPIAGDA
ncbi:MarR family transcriptional regulator [Nitriliruptoraceae bacterium ZYF776]|nr:MarR family transcriptional regulator [Profundirhabdus halotolerans]